MQVARLTDTLQELENYAMASVLMQKFSIKVLLEPFQPILFSTANMTNKSILSSYID